MTLIEIMVAIAVIAFIVIGGLYLFNIIKERHKIYNSVNDLGAIVTVINDIYEYADNYEDLSVESLINSGGIPKHLIIAGNTQHFKGVWGNIDLPVEEDNYTIVFNDVPEKSCSTFGKKARDVYRFIFTAHRPTYKQTSKRKTYCKTGKNNIVFKYNFTPLPKEITPPPADSSPVDGS